MEGQIVLLPDDAEEEAYTAGLYVRAIRTDGELLRSTMNGREWQKNCEGNWLAGMGGGA
jgi:hypothetical protein